MKVNFALNHHWCKTNLLPQAVLSYVIFRDFYCQKIHAIEGSVVYPYKNEVICMTLFHIRFFLYF